MATKSQTASGNLVLRSVFMDPTVDETLRQEAFRRNVSKNDLFRKYLQIGMAAARKLQEPIDLSDLTQRETPKPTYAAELLIQNIQARQASTLGVTARKAPAKSAPAKKAAVKKNAVKKTAVKKVVAKRAAAK